MIENKGWRRMKKAFVNGYVIEGKADSAAQRADVLVEDGKIEIRSQAPGVSTPPPAPIPSKDPLNQWENAPKYRDLRSQDVS